jgi:hypothetical protein
MARNEQLRYQRAENSYNSVVEILDYYMPEVINQVTIGFTVSYI